ncbi:hypothetical protein [Mesorhizobium sp. CN2-181]|uniref:hypothetical protein n=1 Tax=Mesorhizobium yinganensis TaxID=3157707 RepID=UPI0032B7BC17
MSEYAFTAANVGKIVEDQLAIMPGNTAERVRRYLVEPYLSVRPWSYGPELFPCWIVLVDDEKSSGTGIAFCREGVWRPELKWILLWAVPDSGYEHLGQDSSWFTSLEAAFNDSFMSTDPAEN